MFVSHILKTLFKKKTEIKEEIQVLLQSHRL